MKEKIKNWLLEVATSCYPLANKGVIAKEERVIYRDKPKMFDGFSSPASANTTFFLSLWRTSTLYSTELIRALLKARRPIIDGIRVDCLVKSVREVLEDSIEKHIVELEFSYPMLIPATETFVKISKLEISCDK